MIETMNKLKTLIRERNLTKDEILHKFPNTKNINLLYDMCYNSVCEELGINLKKGETIKRKVRLIPKRR